MCNPQSERRRTMRLIIAGAEVTDAVVDILDTLQNEREVGNGYLAALDEVTRIMIRDLDAKGSDRDAATLARLSTLQALRRDIVALMTPPDLHLEINDKPIIEL